MSLRTKFLLITLGGAVLPLALVGVWLSAGARRSGAALLRERLDTALTRVALAVGDQWVGRRSALLMLAEDSLVRRALEQADGAASIPASIPVPSLNPRFENLRDATYMVMLRDAHGDGRWVLASDVKGQARLIPAAESLRVADPRATDAVSVSLPILARASERHIGSVDARLRASSVLPVGAGNAAGAGAVLAAVDRASGVSVVPLPFDAALLADAGFRWGGAQWLTARRELDDPALTLFAAAPLDAYVTPFQTAARRGLFALIAVAAAAVVITTLLARRVTQSLEHLANAADAVARGELDRQVSARGHDEIARVARTFNSMVESLRNTLRALSQRQAVAAVGEFAAALAHEVRNPLSAIKLNLQHAQEKAGAASELHAPVSHALRDVERLERTVAGALRVARSGRMPMETVDLWTTIAASARTARPEFDRLGATIELPPERDRDAIQLRGDAAALEQLFLNLLLNAAQAVPPGGSAGVVSAVHDARVDVTVWDTGTGMTPEERERAFQPFYSTKPEGTGLGLTLARRIAAAHGGSIALDGSPGEGTRVCVSLPIEPQRSNTTS
jgi:signal transduction histidine kinase